MVPNLIYCYIIYCSIPLIITIEYRYRIDFGNPVRFMFLQMLFLTFFSHSCSFMVVWCFGFWGCGLELVFWDCDFQLMGFWACGVRPAGVFGVGVLYISLYKNNPEEKLC